MLSVLYCDTALVTFFFDDVATAECYITSFFFNDTATTEIYTRSLVGSSDVYKRQVYAPIGLGSGICGLIAARDLLGLDTKIIGVVSEAVSYTHLRAHETVLDLVCRLLLEKTRPT